MLMPAFLRSNNQRSFRWIADYFPCRAASARNDSGMIAPSADFQEQKQVRIAGGIKCGGNSERIAFFTSAMCQAQELAVGSITCAGDQKSVVAYGQLAHSHLVSR